MTTTQIAFDLPPATQAPPPFRAAQRAYPKQPMAEVLAVARAAFARDHGIEPTVARINHMDFCDLAEVRGIELRPAHYVSAGSVYVGIEGS